MRFQSFRIGRGSAFGAMKSESSLSDCKGLFGRSGVEGSGIVRLLETGIKGCLCGCAVGLAVRERVSFWERPFFVDGNCCDDEGPFCWEVPAEVESKLAWHLHMR